MIRVLYISTARQRLTPAELDGLLRTSRRNNSAVDVTGLLIAGGRRFLQVLEGPEDAVQATFDRISKDPRHFAVVKLAREPIVERQFAAWSMGHEPGGAYDASGTATQAVAALIAPIADANLRGYFRGFADTQATAA